MKINIYPIRFLGKKFKKNPTFAQRSDDYILKIDGLTAGRIMKMAAHQRVFWVWNLTGPDYPHTVFRGEAETYEDAYDAFTKHFWQWHEWALKQPGGAVMWYGAEKSRHAA